MKFFLFFAAALIFCTDFFLKVWIQDMLPFMNGYYGYPFGGIGVFKNFLGIDFTIVHAINTGAAWGMFASWKYLLVSARILIIIALSLYFLFKAKTNRWPLMLIIVGASGNVADFFRFGHVVDMFYFRFWGYSYPVFNIADSAIFVGALILAWRSFQGKKLPDAHESQTTSH